MGRKDFRQEPQRGPGRKARRQKDPKLPPALLLDAAKAGGSGGVDGKKLTSRQKQRLKRRLVKLSTGGKAAAGKKVVKGKEKKALEDLEAIDDEASGEGVASDGKRLRLDLGGDEDKDGNDDGLMETEEFEDLNDEDFEDEDYGDESEQEADEPGENADSSSEEGEAAEDEAEAEEKTGKKDKKHMRQDGDSAADEEPDPADLSELDGRIDELLQTLSAKGGQKPQAASRSDLVDKLRGLLCARFSYNAFLMTKLIDLYPKDILDFLQSNEVDRPLTLRVNALKTRRKDLAQALIARGVNLDPFDKWSKVGLVVFDSQVPLGATPEYLAGHYMLQGAASMLPVMALDPKPQEKVLDLCAAPGGKTTYIAELMRNTGLVMANEANRERAKAVVGNAHRHGLNNIVVCVGDGREFARTMHNFDRVLVDAPCTGTGVIAKDPAVKANKEEKDVLKCSHLQKQLLLAGIDSARVGGTIVYCTCSVLVEENEAVVDYALRRRAVKIVDSGLPIGEAGFRAFKGRQFHPCLGQARRISPHQHNMDGFFVAKLVKQAAGARGAGEAATEEGKDRDSPAAGAALSAEKGN